MTSNRNTLLGMPPPLHLPASYLERHPPQIDSPVEVLFSISDGDVEVVDLHELSLRLLHGTLSSEEAELARHHLATCPACERDLMLDIQIVIGLEGGRP